MKPNPSAALPLEFLTGPDVQARDRGSYVIIWWWMYRDRAQVPKPSQIYKLNSSRFSDSERWETARRSRMAGLLFPELVWRSEKCRASCPESAAVSPSALSRFPRPSQRTDLLEKASMEARTEQCPGMEGPDAGAPETQDTDRGVADEAAPRTWEDLLSSGYANPERANATVSEARSPALAASAAGRRRAALHSATSAAEAASPKRRLPDEARRIAIALADHPVPHLTKKDIEARWAVSHHLVVKVLRRFGLDPGPTKGLTLALTDVLLCEGEADPLVAWSLGTDDDRTILKAGLLTMEQYREEDPRLTKLHLGTYRRHTREGRLTPIRIGKFYRFRPSLAAALRPDSIGGGSAQ